MYEIFSIHYSQRNKIHFQKDIVTLAITKHNTCAGAGLSGNLDAATRKVSGAGFPFFTSGSEPNVL